MRPFDMGLKVALSFALDSLVMGLVFGFASRRLGLPVLETVLFSALVFQDLGQFFALHFLTLGAPILACSAAVLLAGLRLMPLSQSTVARLREHNAAPSMLATVGLSETSYALLFRGKAQKGDARFLAGLTLTEWLVFVLATAAAALLYGLLPIFLKNGVTIALYAAAAYFLTPQLMQRRSVLLTALLSALLCALLSALMHPALAALFAALIAAAGGLFVPNAPSTPATPPGRDA